MVEVTQADREAAAAAFYCKPLLDVKYNTDRRVQAFARHRIAERERNAEKCDERAALYRAKAGKRDALADDSLNEYERFIGYAEVVDIAAQAIRASSDD